jgi:hypothetical protein
MMGIFPLTFVVFAVAGWFLCRYPVRILDFVFGKDEGQWRPIRFFKIFGIVMMALGSLSAVLTVVFTLLRKLA